MKIHGWTTMLCFAVLLGFGQQSTADDWHQWRGPTRDGVWHETGLIQKFESDQIPLKWKVKIGSGYSAPTVADGRVYVSDRIAEPQQERVLCFNEKDGELIWSHTYPCEYKIGYTAGPRAAITIVDGRAFALGAMGHFHCFDAVNGDLLWHHDLNSKYNIVMPIWGIAGAPLVVGNTVIVQLGGKDACVVGFHTETGKPRWTALAERACYASPLLVKQAGKDVVVVWTGDSISGLNPLTGKLFWRHPFPPSRMPIGVATPVFSRNQLFVTSFYDGCLLLDLKQQEMRVEQVWRQTGPDEKNTKGIHSIISTPIILGEHIYGVDSYGELRCLDRKTGLRVWENKTATPTARWSTVHFVQNGKNVWMFNERGELIISQLSEKGMVEISRAKLIAPTLEQLRRREGVCWAHPAYANKHVFARSDEYLVCASLAADK
ncbi:MAG: PQQ-binding-like beta-propeller repeat protein [Planctomycetota bacterium]|nr:PQQ-binding-like beta-propeller repeat protein [Planctomycetota bacterium]